MTEHAEQVALFEWAEWIMNTGKYPELKWMFAVPNGGHRYVTVAKKLKAEGVKAGVPDVLLPAPSLWGEIGLAIEMKFGKNKTTKKQDKWLVGLRELGWRVVVCYSFDEARWEIEHYLAPVPTPNGVERTYQSEVALEKKSAL